MDNRSTPKPLDEARKQIAELQAANEDKCSLIKKLEQDLCRIKDAAGVDRKMLEEFQKTFQERNLQYEEEQSKRLEHEKTLVSNINSLKAKLSIEATERERSQLMLANASRDIQAKEAEKRALQNSVHELKVEIQSLEQENIRARQLQEECNQMEATISQLEHQLADSTRYCQNLRSRIDSDNEKERELNKRISELCAEASRNEIALKKTAELNRVEKNRRVELYKIISDFSSSVGIPVDADELALTAESGKSEYTQLITMVFSDIRKLIASKDVDLEKQKQEIESLQSLQQEQQKVIRQLYEFVNEKNASICERNPSSEKIEDDEDENRKDDIVNEKNSTSILEELYRKQEAQRSSLLRMESQLRTLQSVHSHCGMRRTLQEARIGELETMMA
ncbi:Hypothetical protein NTJ_14929 [Nesidiocoris tenuis]|uniref:Uncharacterized protein n=1 Tax=Nesidiocoris tenuis TaxID=355587 RepID=A0ABN7BCQ6_9HEMI|nr:Hypothetical protein NTJ_14929 [Nesidiocoris tenuis]